MTYNVEIFGIHLKLNPIAFTLPIGKNGWDIYWYGIIIATGFLLAVIYALKNAKRYEINTDRMLDVVLVTTPVAIFCARTYYVLFDGVKLNGISDFFGFGESSGFAGIAIYGAVIGAFGCGALMCYIRKVNILDMFDLAATGFLIGQGIGRWGNFVNQEAFGGPTGSSWWGMTSEAVKSDFYSQGFNPDSLAHPCFLYESIWCIAGFFLIHYLSKKRKFRGQMILTYGVWYGFERAIIELLRTDSLMIGNLKVSSILSAILCVSCGAALVYFYKKSQKSTDETVYESVFAENTDEDLTDTLSDENNENGEDSNEQNN